MEKIMSMIKAEVRFRVTTKVGGRSVSTETIIMQVDLRTYRASQNNHDRKELSGWAKQFFPSALEVEVQMMKQLYQ